jgi:hypothetical protein
VKVSQLSSLAKRDLVGPAALVLAAGFATASLGGASAPPAGTKGASAAATDRFGLGNHTWKVTTESPAAQRAFDRGLTLAYGFSHGAAELEFRKAAEADPDCAMAWWGVALVNGPHINLPTVSETKARTAWDALQRARRLSAKAGAEERALIEALGKRYADPQPADRKPLDEAYAAAMREVWKANPKDADVATLFAEAMMDLRPWDLWTKDGKPQPGTEEILRTLEAAMRIDPNHPGANHFYIHAVEGSPEPGKALVQADKLAALAPGASHLVHMPAHIYARVGRWPDASASNVDAIAADAAYRAANPRPGFYAMYMAHDNHFFAYAETAQGHGAAAIGAARKMVAEMPPEFFRDFGPFADFYTAFVPEILMRFGKWEEILKEPEPAEDLPLSRAFWREARGVALTALGRLEEAESERQAFRKAAALVPEGYPCGNNTAKEVMAIASRLLDGEIAAKAGRLEESERLLREAVRAEDDLAYDEPPDWMQPVRHTLGAVLLRDGKFAEAETVYREDLAVEPNNGWGLYGLARSCRLQKKEAEAADAEARFSKVWRGADVKLKATCLCQPPT